MQYITDPWCLTANTYIPISCSFFQEKNSEKTKALENGDCPAPARGPDGCRVTPTFVKIWIEETDPGLRYSAGIYMYVHIICMYVSTQYDLFSGWIVCLPKGMQTGIANYLTCYVPSLQEQWGVRRASMDVFRNTVAP